MVSSASVSFSSSTIEDQLISFNMIVALHFIAGHIAVGHHYWPLGQFIKQLSQ